MRHLLPLLVVLAFVACKKSDYTIYYPTPPGLPYTPVDTINEIFISPRANPSWDTSNNGANYLKFTMAARISGQGFGDGDKNVGEWFKYFDLTKDTYYLKYIGSVPLFNADSIILRGEWYINFRAAKQLLNKPIFEARNITNDSLYKTYVYADSGAAFVQYYYPDTAKIPRWTMPADLSNNQVADAFNYYITPAKLAPIAFYFHPGPIGN